MQITAINKTNLFNDNCNNNTSLIFLCIQYLHSQRLKLQKYQNMYIMIQKWLYILFRIQSFVLETSSTTFYIALHLNHVLTFVHVVFITVSFSIQFNGLIVQLVNVPSFIWYQSIGLSSSLTLLCLLAISKVFK